MFSKMLQELSIADTAEAMARLGFDGVDLTVRDQGHILPENVAEELPPACETFRQKGLVVGMLTTGITSAEDEHAETLFRTASECGVRFLKLGYWTYEGFGSIKRQIEAVRADLQALEALALEHGVNATIHTHSGNFMTADLPICHMLTEGLDPDAIGIYVDAGHIVLEGGYGVWRQGLDLVSDRIRLIAAKNLGWFAETDTETGRVVWKRRVVPCDQGMTDWKEFFKCLQAAGYDGYVSMHSEYTDLALDDLIAQTEADLKLMKDVLAELE
jgi:sugar phosphate isomerase/epimerase